MGTWVLANQADSYWHNHDAPNQTNGGPTFRVQPPAYVTHLRYWRDAIGRGQPTTLGLWRVSDQIEIANVVTPTDNFQVGWQVSPLPAPVQLAGSTDYVVAGFFPPDGGCGTSNSGDALGASPTGTQITSQVRRYHDGPPYQYPDQSITNYRFGLDAFIEFGTPDPGEFNPVTPNVLSGELSSWLLTNGSNYPGSAIQQMRSVTDANNTGINQLLNRISQAWADTVLNNTNGLPGFFEAFSNFQGQFTALTAGPIADLLDAIGEKTDISALGYLAELVRWANGLNQRPNVGTPDAFDIAETTYETDLLWEQPADEYIVFVDTIPPIRSQEIVASIDTRHRLGWYSTYGAGAASQRGYIDFPICRIPSSNGIRMPGLLLTTGAGSAGHVQAFTYKEASGGS